MASAVAGDESTALQLAPEVLKAAEDLGHPTITSAARFHVAESLAILGSPGEALGLIEASVAEADAVGPIIASDTRVLYAIVADDPGRAARVLRPAVAMAKERLSGSHQIAPLIGTAKILADTGRQQPAARLLGACQTNLDWEGGAGGFVFLLLWWYEPLIERLASAMGSVALDDELRHGGQLSPAQALRLAQDALAELA